MTLKIASTFLIVLFTLESISHSEGFVISSKEEARVKLKAQRQTYNESYPGGPTTPPISTTPSETTTTTIETTQPPSTTAPTPTCPPQVQNYLLVYVLVPICTLVGFGAGIGVHICWINGRGGGA